MRRTVTVRIDLRGRGSIMELSTELSGIDGVLSVRGDDGALNESDV